MKKKLDLYALSILSWLFPLYAHAVSPATFTYQGKIFQSNGVDPLVAPSVIFKIQVRSSDGLCLLFEETHSRDMTGTAGIFSLIIGEGSNTNVSGLTIAQSFDNTTVKTGAASCSYTPTVGDTRRLRLSYFDGTQTVSLPTDQVIRSVPYAFESQSLQGLGKDKFVQTSTQITQSKIETLAANEAALTSLANGTSTLYAKSSDLPYSSGYLDLTGGGVKVPDVPGTSTSAVNKTYSDSNVAGKTVDLSSLTDGKILVWDSTANKWKAQAPVSGTVTSVTASAPLSVATGTSTPVISLTAGAATGHSLVWNGSAWAGAYINVAQLRSAGGAYQFPTNCTSAQTLVYYSPNDLYMCTNILITNAQVSGLGTASTMNVGTASGTVAAGNDSRIINAVQSGDTASGDITGSWATLVVAKIRGIAVSTTAPTNGQILKYNSTTSKWEPAVDLSNAGTVTSVVAGSGLSGGTITGSGTFSVDTGTTADKIVKLDGNGKLPAIDGSQLTNMPSIPFSQVDVLSTAGTVWWTPPTGVSKVYVQVWGSGGGGGGGSALSLAGGGGSAGAYGAGFINVTAGVPVAVVVGLSGTAGTAGSGGGNGNPSSITSTFGNISANGGSGGYSTGQTPVAGGVSTALINIAGGSGSAASPFSGVSVGGMGGSAGGGGGPGGGGSASAAINAASGSAPGGGGGGGGSGALAGASGGAGGTGRVVIWY